MTKQHPTIHLKPVDHNNWYACTQLEVTAEQKNVFPVPMVYWLAESAYCGYTALAMYTEQHLVGLAVYAIDPDDGNYWIMAYMIDRKHQHNGLGRAGMEQLMRHLQKKHACQHIFLGHRPENERAAHLYTSVGFVVVDHGAREIIRKWSSLRV